MSHRVTTSTEMKDKTVLDKVLTSYSNAGGPKGGNSVEGGPLTYTQKGNIITFQSGKLKNATLDLSTGEMAGDTDYQSEADLGSLRQAYAVEKVKTDVVRRGGSVSSVTTAKDGTIRIVANVSV